MQQYSCLCAVKRRILPGLRSRVTKLLVSRFQRSRSWRFSRKTPSTTSVSIRIDSEYTGLEISVCCRGIFFDLRREDLSACCFVYDRAALIAMELPDRPRYYDHMLSILSPLSSMLLITLEYDQKEMTGPPFSVPTEEMFRHYADTFSIHMLESSSIIDERPRWRKVGLTGLTESIFRLDR